MIVVLFDWSHSVSVIGYMYIYEIWSMRSKPFQRSVQSLIEKKNQVILSIFTIFIQRSFENRDILQIDGK